MLSPITMPISVKSAESLSFIAPPEGRKRILRYYSFRFYPIITQMGTQYLYSDVIMTDLSNIIFYLIG